METFPSKSQIYNCAHKIDHCLAPDQIIQYNMHICEDNKCICDAEGFNVFLILKPTSHMNNI